MVVMMIININLSNQIKYKYHYKMPSELGKKGLEKGLITQKQYDKLPAHLLDAIVKKKMGTGGGAKKKGGGKKKK
jgi:hypothetical protein